MREEKARASVTTASTCGRAATSSAGSAWATARTARTTAGSTGTAASHLWRAFAVAAAVQRRIGDAADGEHTRRHRAYDQLFPGQRHKD